MSRRIGNAILIVALLLLVYALAAKFGFVHAFASLREMVLIIFVLSFAARVLRRRRDRPASQPSV